MRKKLLFLASLFSFRKSLLFFGTALLTNTSFAQSECAGGRYSLEIFSDYDLTSDITYGSSIKMDGNSQTLLLDIYEPQGDTLSLRPLLVMAHGGSYAGGSKTGTDVVPLCESFSKMGYVAVSYEYRVGLDFFNLDSANVAEAVMRGVQDAKAAVRFFYQSAQSGNPYRIDTNRILIGGVSAGAFNALHYAYLDEWSEVPVWIDTTQNGLGGGLEGLSGNPGYSTDVIGVFNVCGALGDSAWIHAGDEPLVSLHGDVDQTVPFGSQMLILLGFYPVIVVDGSFSLADRANDVGIENCFYPHWGADHVPHVGNAAYLDTTMKILSGFISGIVCNTQPNCSLTLGNSFPSENISLSIFPNPALNEFRIRIPGAFHAGFNFSLIDLAGKELMNADYSSSNELIIDRGNISPGIYFIRISEGFHAAFGKVVLE